MIQVENLMKTYKEKRGKSVQALKQISFQCHPGRVYGLLGPNGAGKTTALRIISTAISATGGSVTVQGHDVRRQAPEVRKNVGFLAANTGLYGRLKPREVLTYFGRLFEMDKGLIRRRIDELAETLKMTDFLDRPCDKLSTGMKQKVNIARTVLHDPPVMVFDEPTSGLDVITGRAIVDFIRRCQQQNKTILFSTHIMAEVQRLCDEVGVIHQGSMRFDGTLAGLKAEYGDDLEEAFLTMCEETSPR